MCLRKIDYSQDFFSEKTSLTVSGQLEGEIYAMALSEVYTFGPTFRAENSNTSRHLSEFWMVEPEMGVYDLNDDMDIEIGKVLISEKYSFGLIKVKDKDFDFNEVYKSGTADIKILRPNWLNL